VSNKFLVGHGLPVKRTSIFQLIEEINEKKVLVQTCRLRPLAAGSNILPRVSIQLPCPLASVSFFQPITWVQKHQARLPGILEAILDSPNHLSRNRALVSNDLEEWRSDYLEADRSYLNDITRELCELDQ